MRRKQRKPSKVPDQQYRRYTAETLANAYAAVKEKGMPVKTAAQHFKVPCQTLRDRVKGKVDPNRMSTGSETMFRHDEELCFVEHLESMSQEGYRYSNSQLRSMAGNLALLLGKRETGKPLSRNWTTGFYKRWGDRITTEKLRYPDGTNETKFYPEELFEDIHVSVADQDASISGKIMVEEHLIQYKDMLEGYVEPPPSKRKRIVTPRTYRKRKPPPPTNSDPESEEVSDSDNEAQSESDVEYETQSDSDTENVTQGDSDAENETPNDPEVIIEVKRETDDEYVTDSALSTNESDEDTNNVEEEICCVCQNFSPPNLADYPTVKKVTWVGCDACNHWVHLMFCYKTRLRTAFLCPHCQQ